MVYHSLPKHTHTYLTMDSNSQSNDSCKPPLGSLLWEQGHGSLGVVSELEPCPGASVALTGASETHHGLQAHLTTKRAAAVWLARHIR